MYFKKPGFLSPFPKSNAAIITSIPRPIHSPNQNVKQTAVQPTPTPHFDFRLLLFPLASLFFSLAASLFPNGNPLVRLSAPVRLLVRAGSRANSSAHTPKQNSAALPTSPAPKANVHPPTTCVYR